MSVLVMQMKCMLTEFNCWSSDLPRVHSYVGFVCATFLSLIVLVYWWGGRFTDILILH